MEKKISQGYKARKALKQRIYINEFHFKDGVLMVNTYTKTREELGKMEDYAIIHMDDEKLIAAICKEGDKEAIEEAIEAAL